VSRPASYRPARGVEVVRAVHNNEVRHASKQVHVPTTVPGACTVRAGEPRDRSVFSEHSGTGGATAVGHS
jgi:hypothetical protein